MNRYFKVLTLVMIMVSSVYLPNVYAISSSETDMLITIAEDDPVLIERLNDIAINDAVLLQQLFSLADSDATQLERLLDLADSDPETFAMLVTIKEAATTEEETTETETETEVVDELEITTFGTVSSGGLMR